MGWGGLTDCIVVGVGCLWLVSARVIPVDCRTTPSTTGVSGPFWYAAGATIQVLLFGILAVELKRYVLHVIGSASASDSPIRISIVATRTFPKPQQKPMCPYNAGSSTCTMGNFCTHCVLCVCHLDQQYVGGMLWWTTCRGFASVIGIHHLPRIPSFPPFLACTVTVTAMLLLGGAAVMQSLTGMNLYGMCGCD